MELKVSIIIPCYNIELHLRKCINSVLAQTYENFELLLINDGSTDNTFNICEEYKEKDNRIKVFSHENKGVSYTRNRGVELADGNYIMFVDGDDWIEKEMLDSLTEPLNPDEMNICGMINEKNGQIKENKYYRKLLDAKLDQIENDSFITLVENYQMSSPCCKLYHKSIILDKNIRFDEKITYQEDIVFNLIYFKNISVIKLQPYFGYHYIEHESSSSSKFHKNFNHLNHLMHLLRYYSSNLSHEKVIRVFVLDSILKWMSNISHPSSSLLKFEKINEYEKVLISDEFNYCREEIKNSPLNPLFKIILLIKNAHLTYAYYLLIKQVKLL